MLNTCLLPPAPVDGGGSVTPDPGPDPGPGPDPNANILWGIIHTGQSLSVGAYGSPVVNPTTRYSNLKFGFDYVAGPWHRNGTLIPLGEEIRWTSNYPYPYNIEGESWCTAMSDQISSLSITRTTYDFQTIQTVVGKDGWAMIYINNNGIHQPPTPTDPVGTGYSFEAAFDEIADIKPLALSTLGKTYKVAAISLEHGESDAPRDDYGADVYQLWSDYNTRVKAATGQTEDVFLLGHQASSGYPTDTVTLTRSSDSFWKACLAHPTQLYCCGPKYQLDYETTTYYHLTAPASQRIGIKRGQVFDAVKSGAGWTPLQPTAVGLSGSTITLTVHVPVAPLQWDTTINVGHTSVHTAWQNGKGFEVVDVSNNEITINSVSISGANQITIVCATPPGAGSRLRYAMAGDGPTTQRKGQLCDSDPFIGVDSQTLSCTVTNGSNTVVYSGTLNHGKRDIVSGSGFAANTIITGISGTTLTLSNPWTGSSGTASLGFRSDQRNYLVVFDLPTSYP